MPKKNNPRLAIPHNVLKLLDLARLIAQKHESDGAASPLNNVAGVDWTTLEPLIAQADALHSEAAMLKMQAEDKIAQRNMLLERLKAGTRRSGAYLKALHSDNAHALGAWGFEVNASVGKKRGQKGAKSEN